MRNLKKIVAIAGAIGILSVSGVVFADAFKAPAAIAAELTGKTVTEVTEARQDGKTYGTQASEAGKLDEFKTQMLEAKKLILDQRVKDKRLTQAQADEIMAAIDANMANCDGTNPGNSQIGRKMGAGFGGGMGMGQGLCDGNGFGQGAGKGMGGGFGRNVAQ